MDGKAIVAVVTLCALTSGCVVPVPLPDTAASAKADSLSGERDALQHELDSTNRSLANASAELSQKWSEYNLSRSELDSVRRDVDGAREQRNSWERSYRETAAQLATANENLTTLRAELETARATTSVDSRVKTLEGELKVQADNFAELTSRYDSAIQGKYSTISTVEAGNLSWHFVDLRADSQAWTYSFDSYRAYVKTFRPDDQVYLKTSTNKVLTVADPRPYVTPSFFTSVIGDLTQGRTDHQFVREAFNLKRQMIVYNFSLVDKNGYYKYPAETMTEGTGICGDTTILLASLLAAGNASAHYGFSIFVWIGELDPNSGEIIEPTTEINHAFIEVKYANGDDEYIETTSRSFTTYPGGVWGWQYGLSSADLAR